VTFSILQHLESWRLCLVGQVENLRAGWQSAPFGRAYPLISSPRSKQYHAMLWLRHCCSVGRSVGAGTESPCVRMRRVLPRIAFPFVI
jgi:hypothetical protein